MRLVLLPVLTVASVAMAFHVAVAQNRRDGDADRACFYRDVNFQGTEWCYRPGDELADLRNRRNEISSIRITGRARVIVYDDREFAGDTDEFVADVPDLTLRNMSGSRSWNDRIDSFQVESRDFRERGRQGRPGRVERDDDDRNPFGRRGGICVYEHADFRGRSECWEAGEEERNFSRIDGLNDRVSSIRVFGRARAELYRDAQYRGESLQVERDVRDLATLDWDDQISSIEVR
jgi:hypothetical protein